MRGWERGWVAHTHAIGHHPKQGRAIDFTSRTPRRRMTLMHQLHPILPALSVSRPGPDTKKTRLSRLQYFVATRLHQYLRQFKKYGTHDLTRLVSTGPTWCGCRCCDLMRRVIPIAIGVFVVAAAAAALWENAKKSKSQYWMKCQRCSKLGIQPRAEGLQMSFEPQS